MIKNHKYTQGKSSGTLTADELKRVEQYLIRTVQQKEFGSEITLLY